LIESAFKNTRTYEHFLTTTNRIEDILNEPLRSMFSHREGINFEDMIRDKWVVLVNLDADGALEPIHTRLLGTAIINEILSSIHRMRRTRNWSKPYYLYIDEAADYANRKLARVLSHKGKTGLKVYLAHQYTSQFEDRVVLDSILNNCHTKIMFNVMGRVDRDLMTRMMYGGDISDRDASFANSNLPKQTMVYKEPKGDPKRWRVIDCITPVIPYPNEKAVIKEILQQAWYYPIKREDKTIYKQAKHDAPGTSHPSPKKASKAAHRPVGKTAAPASPTPAASESEDPFRRLSENEVFDSTDGGKQ
jgi:Type IV secretion-system coupling protein DNA-binding domain.